MPVKGQVLSRGKRKFLCGFVGESRLVSLALQGDFRPQNGYVSLVDLTLQDFQSLQPILFSEEHYRFDLPAQSVAWLQLSCDG